MARLIRLLTGVLLCGVMLVPALGADAAPSVYIVRSGDSLYAIASRLDVRLDDLLRVNRLTLRSVIMPGQRLTVPGSGSSSGGSVGTTYVVKPGDWLSKIASRHGVTLRALLDANDLTATSLIVPGQRLVIPSTSGGGGGGGSSVGGGGSGGGGGTSYTTYTVKAGDWLSKIASRHGITLQALLTANRLTATSLIVPGQQLRIPRSGSGGGGTPSRPPAPPVNPPVVNPPVVNPPAAGPTYTVRPGDSLGAIASQHDVTIDALLAVNRFSRSTVIRPGQQMKLPAGAKLTRLDRVLGYALAQVGKQWRFFSRGPDAFDCSGLTLAAYAQIGVPLIHYSAAQAMQGTEVDFINEPIRAGDLVFQDTDGDGIINHVGIALSGSTWVHSRSSRLAVAWGALPVDSRIVAVRRILPDT
jgi:peptidoglycan endopeptidase LytE